MVVTLLRALLTLLLGAHEAMNLQAGCRGCHCSVCILLTEAVGLPEKRLASQSFHELFVKEFTHSAAQSPKIKKKTIFT